MSRIGKLPIAVPSGVDVAIDEQLVTVKGPKGTLSHTVAAPITVEKGEGASRSSVPNDERESRSLHGLTRTLINNMVVGCHRRLREEARDRAAWVTASCPRARPSWSSSSGTPTRSSFDAPEGITFTVESPTRLGVQGIDKQLVGETAAKIRKLRKPEPYKGKGVRYAGEHIRRKVGKAGK